MCQRRSIMWTLSTINLDCVVNKMLHNYLHISLWKSAKIISHKRELYYESHASFFILDVLSFLMTSKIFNCIFIWVKMKYIYKDCIVLWTKVECEIIWCSLLHLENEFLVLKWSEKLKWFLSTNCKN